MGRQIVKGGAPAEILIVEDNPGDARLFEEHLSEADISNPVHHVDTADQALDFVYQREEFADAPTPDVIFLDWRLPKATAETVVQELPADSDPKDIFTAVLTGSMRDLNSIVPSDLGVDGFLTKPMDTDELLSLVESAPELSLSGRRD